MYNHILNGLFVKNRLSTIEEKSEFLQTLQNDVRGIRKAYNAFPVRFDYKNINVQAGYLITYVPHYTDLLHFVLTESGNAIAKENIEDLILIGSGPCPEIIGYLRYINENSTQNTINLTVNIFDIAIEEWKWSRDIIFADVVPNYSKNKNIIRNEGKIDISRKFKFKFNQLKKIIVFQNCLNEITSETHNILISNVNDMFADISSGSYLVLIDLYFWQVQDLMISTEKHIEKNFKCKVIRSATEKIIEYRTKQTNEPKIVLDNLLIDKFGSSNPTGLLPKRNLKFIYSLIQKE